MEKSKSIGHFTLATLPKLFRWFFGQLKPVYTWYTHLYRTEYFDDYHSSLENGSMLATWAYVMWGRVYSRRGKSANKDQGTASATEPREAGAATPWNSRAQKQNQLTSIP
jgi:hypothetical protein